MKQSVPTIIGFLRIARIKHKVAEDDSDRESIANYSERNSFANHSVEESDAARATTLEIAQNSDIPGDQPSVQSKRKLFVSPKN